MATTWDALPACNHAARPCRVKNGGFLCTEPPGHSGPHIACGTDNHHLSVWDRDAYPWELDRVPGTETD